MKEIGEEKRIEVKRNKRKYRGKGKLNKRDKTFSVLLVNMRGFKGKKTSLKRIIKNVKPGMVCINETQLSGREKVTLDPYTCWTKNRSEQVGGRGGGVATAVAPRYKESAIGAGEGEGEDEYLITRIQCFSPALNVVNCYGEQRGIKGGKDVIEARWNRLRKELEAIRARNEFCLLTGDLNKLVGCDELGVPGNKAEVSPGGKLLRAMLATRNWILVNSLGQEVVEGGPFTRLDPASGVLSCLDLFVVSRELWPYVSSLFIDSQKKWTLARTLKTRRRVKLVYSDHFPCLLTFNNLPMVQEKKEDKQTRWNLAKKGGWKHYETVSDELSEKLENIVEDESISVEETKKEFDKVHDKIRFKTFGKVTITTKEKPEDEDEEEGGKSLTEEEKAQSLYEEQKQRAAEEVAEIEMSTTSRVGKVWEVKKRIIGGKKATLEKTAIINPNTGKMAVSKKEIKEVTLNYCKETLTNNEPAEGFKEEIEMKKKLVKDILSLKGGSFKATKATFQKMVLKFKQSNKRNYDFLTKAGPKFQEVVFKFCHKMFENEEFPKDFQETTLHMIFKGGKSSRSVLSGNRFIHSKAFFARAAEGLVVEDGLKAPLLAGSSIYQIGGQPGHRPEELVFVMKSVIALYRIKGKMLVINFYDLSKYFDKEMIEDAVISCWKRKADIKAIKLWYKLNEQTKIRVKTGAGMSEYEEVGAVLGQGTLGGAIISQAVLDDGVMEHFTPGEEGQPRYGSVPLAPCMYQDDLANGSEGLLHARVSNQKVDFLVKQRGLELNRDKSVCIILGSKKQKLEASKELEQNPLKCGDFITKEKAVEKWLGQFISAAGLTDSVAKTVEAREGKIRGACMEIAQIVSDWRASVVGGMETALVMWEACCIPSLLNGAGTWMEMSEETERKLNALQRWFHRLIYQVGPGAPMASLCWDTTCLEMGLRVWREKLMLALHIRSLGEETLAHRMYSEQQTWDWPGLVGECENICNELNIESVNTTQLGKTHYRKVVTSACHKENEKRLRAQADGKIKCERIKEEVYEKKPYISEKQIQDVRNMYRTRFGMQPFAGNYSHDQKFKKTNFMCRCTKEREEEQHIMSGDCPVYADIRAQFQDFGSDDDLVRYFTMVLDRRDELDGMDAEESED